LEVSLEIASLEADVRNLLDEGGTPLPETAGYESSVAAGDRYSRASTPGPVV
jgi:hypothetical protein